MGEQYEIRTFPIVDVTEPNEFSNQMWQRVRDLSISFHETLDRECLFALFDGYPWDDLTIVTEHLNMRHALYYDPFHELIDAPLNSYPDFTQAKQLAVVMLDLPDSLKKPLWVPKEKFD